jgi:hypothetical protein
LRKSHAYPLGTLTEAESPEEETGQPEQISKCWQGYAGILKSLLPHSSLLCVVCCLLFVVCCLIIPNSLA